MSSPGLVELMTARERITKLQERIDRLERHLALLEKQWTWTDDEVEDAREAANEAYRLAHAARAAVREGED
jgi:chaperonin cofactor prefoldin